MSYGPAYLFKDGKLTDQVVRLDWPEFHLPVGTIDDPNYNPFVDMEKIPASRRVRIDVYKRHGMRGKHPVYSYVRTDER